MLDDENYAGNYVDVFFTSLKMEGGVDHEVFMQ
jgi:hypothetical protein